MAQFTLSLHQKPNAAHRGHNIRNGKVIKNMQHINPDLIDNNLILRDSTLREAYIAAYEESTERFKAEQIRKKVRESRRVKDYYTTVKNDSKRNLVYEIILQIGDHDTIGYRTSYTPQEEAYLNQKQSGLIQNNDIEMEKSISRVQNARKAYEALCKFVETWDQRNPNMYLYGAYLHADEDEGTLHMHLDYLPLATGYVKGQDVQNGLDRACQQNLDMRLTPEEIKKRRKQHTEKTHKALMTAENMWQDLQRQDLQELAREIGLDLVWDQDTTKKQRHMETPEYKEKMQMFRQLQEEIEKTESLRNRQGLLLEELMEDIHLKRQELEQNSDQADQIQIQITTMEEERDQLISATGRLKKKQLEQQDALSELQAQLDDLSKSRTDLESEVAALRNTNNQLKRSISSKQNQIEDLEQRMDATATMLETLTENHITMAQEAEAEQKRIETKLQEEQKRLETARNATAEQIAAMQETIRKASEQKMAAIRQADAAKAEAMVLRTIVNASKGLTTPAGTAKEIKILREDLPKRRLLGEITEHTVTIRKKDFDQLKNTEALLRQGKQLTRTLFGIKQEMSQEAAILTRNMIDSHEVAVDQRIQDMQKQVENEKSHRKAADNRAQKEIARADQLQRQQNRLIREAREESRESAFSEARSYFQEIIDGLKRKVSDLLLELEPLKRLRKLIDHCPDLLKQIEERAEVATSMAEVLIAYINDEDHPYIDRTDEYPLTYPNSEYKYTFDGLLKQYYNECEKNDLTPDPDIEDHVYPSRKRSHHIDEWDLEL